MDSTITPVLASQLWLAARQWKRGPKGDGTGASQNVRLSSGLTALDSTLDGGFDCGGLTHIAGEKGSKLSDLLNSLIITHLLSHERGRITIIVSSSGSSFNLPGLHQHLLRRTRETHVQDLDARDDASALLRRVNIIRVLDLIGMNEGISELREGLEQRALTRAQEASRPPFKSTISDSEDDGANDVFPPRKRPCSSMTARPEQNDILIIDNLAELTSLGSPSESVQAYALLESSMRWLARMTRSYELCTLLVTETHDVTTARAESSPSIFSSCKAAPAMHASLAHVVDMRVLLSLVPVTANDALAAYKEHVRSQDGRIEYGTVVEVLVDRKQDRAEKWSAIGVNDDGAMVDL